MKEPPSRDFLDKARLAAAALMLAAAAAAIAGSLLDWVVIVEQPDVAPNTRFEAGEEIDQPNRRTPYSGIEARDGWIVIAAAGILLVSAVLLATTKRSSFAWLGFLATIPIGAIAIADYRSISDPQSSLAR